MIQSGNYVITGKLGAGKSLCAISRMQEYLREGRPIATNIDIKIEKLLDKTIKNARVYRLPDHPKLADFEAIGLAYEGPYDESKMGGIFLDECGTWLNARDWQESSKRPLLDYLLHIRKRRWNLHLIIQDISMLDKQYRKALAEHVVYCRRFDRMKLPIFGWILNLLGMTKHFPKMHLGIVKYGDNPNSLTIDQWWYRATDLYSAYDTSQIFSHTYSDGTYMKLPPAYIFRDYAKRNVRFFMKLTKIYLRKYSRLMLLATGMLSGGFAYAYLIGDVEQPQQQEQKPQKLAMVNKSTPENTTTLNTEPIESEKWRVVGHITGGGGKGAHQGNSWVTGTKNEVQALDMILITDGQRIRKIRVKECRLILDSYECIVDGEIVTEWTGRP